jgi:hypothetical protein
MGNLTRDKCGRVGGNMGCSSFHTINNSMSVPQLNSQLQTQLSQWIYPQDQRHLQVFCENVAAILQAQSACLSHWLPYLSHRDCQARSHMERLHYFVHNPKITAETFYFPLLQQSDLTLPSPRDKRLRLGSCCRQREKRFCFEKSPF